MSAPILLDLSHTSHTRARTGIQRVARSLWRELGTAAQSITFDPHQRAWRPLDPWELENLATDSFSKKRGASWPLTANSAATSPPPRHFSSQLSALSSQLFRSAPSRTFQPHRRPPPSPPSSRQPPARGPPYSHDAIALKFPELTPSKTVARFPAYLRELLAFDGIAANSEDSRTTLLAYWDWLGIPASAQPLVTAIPLGIDPVCHLTGDNFPGLRSFNFRLSALNRSRPSSPSAASKAAKTISPSSTPAKRSGQPAYVSNSHLIGLSHPQTGRLALERLRALQSAGRPIRYDGPASDTDLAAAYAACTFTVYPSLIEGFGLPVLESLARGKPCVCSAHGALGEAARDGGCLTLDRVDAPALAAAIGRLVSSPAELSSLATAARARRFRSWSDYARDVSAWLAHLPRRT